MDSTRGSDRDSASPPSLMRRAAVVVAALGLLWGLVACGDDDSTSDGGSSGGSGSADATLEVDSIAYHDVTVPAGGTLEIDNTSGTNHTFTADDGSFDVAYDSGETVEVEVPSEPGEYPFHCEIHSSMKATLTVE